MYYYTHLLYHLIYIQVFWYRSHVFTDFTFYSSNKSFSIVFKNFFTNPDVIEKVKPQLALIIPAGAPITLTNDAIEMLPDNIDKTFNDLSKIV